MEHEDQSVSTVTRRFLVVIKLGHHDYLLQIVIKFQHTTIDSCVHGSIVDSLLKTKNQDGLFFV